MPWDAPPSGGARYPDWVAADDALASVRWEPAALASLDAHAALLAAAGYDAKRDPSALAAARATLDEVLRQDPRNKRQRIHGRLQAKIRGQKEAAQDPSFPLGFDSNFAAEELASRRPLGS